jgi:RNA polymerase sigma-70 factor (ECF subfamily)
MLVATRVGREPDTGNAKRPDITGKSGSHSVSFEAFYQAEHARVFGYFRRKVGRDDAPDLTQEAFMRFYGSGKFAEIEYPRAYLTRIAHNIWLNRIRQQKRRGILYPFDEACDAPTPPEQERRLEARDLRRAYWRTLRPLSRKTRRIFLMHRLRGMTYQSIADELGISSKAVEKRMGRALARCRRVGALRHG